MSCINVAYSGSAKIIFPKFPEVTLYAQQFSLPGVSAIYPELYGPTARTPLSPTAIRYEPLIVTFLIGESFTGYRTILEWLQNSRTMKHSDVFSDATVTLLTSEKTPFQNVFFTDVEPVSCNPIPFDITLSEPQPIRAVATFDYTQFTFE